MPRVEIAYVVSFSDEDPMHPASNLLQPDVKSQWLCSAGQPTCSVVLQLKTACKIDSITIGAYHVALIEVLVGLSEKPNDPFEVLVPSCVLLSPSASRRGEAVECVRTFGAPQLAGAAAARRWDRVRLVCSQPYNKHCKYGLAFVHMSSADAPAVAAAVPPAVAAAVAPVVAPAVASAVAPPRALQLDAEAGSSDDEFRPGELFAKHQRTHSTEAQIRQASSQALKNIPDASTKLTKTPIAKTGNKQLTHSSEQRSDRTRDSLLYTDDDRLPHDKIDRIVQRHRDINSKGKTDAAADQNKQDKENTGNKLTDQSEGTNKLNNSRANDTLNRSNASDDGETRAKQRDKTPQNKHAEKNAATNSTTASHKRKRAAESHPELGPVCAAPGEVLAGAAVAMSGYVNPRRAALRAVALELGARYLRDWEPACTHLICAFPNTPKLKAVRAARAATVAVRGEWLEQCRAHRRRLPWRWFAAEPREREPAPQHLDRLLGDHEPEGDTDDEIEKVLKQQGKKQRRTSSDERTDTGGADERDHTDDTTVADVSRDSDVAFVRDERVQAQISLHSDSDATDEDERGRHPDSVEITNELPPLWAGCTFALSQQLAADDAALLTRYIRAYGGLVLQESEVLEDSSVQYVVARAGAGGAACARARTVRPEWVWRQHAHARVMSNDHYKQ